MGSGRGEAKSSPRRVSAAERRLRAFDLRKAGMAFELIAKQPISADDPRPLYPGPHGRKRAFEAVDGLMLELAGDTVGRARELRALELAKLDDMEIALTPATRPSRSVRCPVDGCHGVLYREVDIAAAHTRIRLGERRSKLLGLDVNDVNDGRMVDLLEQQVAVAHSAMVKAMDRAGCSPELQREVLGHVGDVLREIEEGHEG